MLLQGAPELDGEAHLGTADVQACVCGQQPLREAYTHLLVGDAEPVEVGVFVIPLDGQVSALVKQRKSRVHGLRGYVKGLGGFLQLIHRGDVCAEMLHLADKVGGRT